MYKWIGISALGLAIILFGLRGPYYANEYAVDDFARLPVLEGGRLKPLDSLARNALLAIHGKQTVVVTRDNGAGRERRQAIVWFMDLSLAPERAADYPLFRIEHDGVLGLLGQRQSEQKYFSFKGATSLKQVVELHLYLLI